MTRQGPNLLDRVLVELADRQFGVVARAQLLAAGVSADAIAAAVGKKRLRPLFRGVYAVGHIAIRREGWWLAAQLSCGEGAVLAGRSAGQLWKLRSGELFPISLIVPSDAGRKRRGLAVRRASLARGETLRVDGIAVTSTALTLVDLFSDLGPRQRRELVERAQDLKRFREPAIRRCLERRSRCRGRRPLLDCLELLEAGPDGTCSHLERLFLALIRTAGVPRPEVNARIVGRRRDFVWCERRLVVEVDGYRYHSSRAALRRDKARDRELIAAAWRPARFTYEEVAFEPAYVVEELRKLL